MMQNQTKRMGNTAYIIGAEFVYILLGVLLIAVPQIKLIHICYGLSAILVIMGIVLIVRYFLTESYRNFEEYGFSVGALAVILGMCALVRADSWVNSFLPILGIALLFMTIVKLQYALDLKSMKDPLWGVVLFFSLVLIIGAVGILVYPFKDLNQKQKVVYVLLIADGVVGIMANLYYYIRLKLFWKKENTIDVSNEGMKNPNEDNVDRSDEILVEEIEG